VAWFVYGSGRIDWQALRARFAGPKRAMERGLYVNDFYSGVIVAPAKAVAAFAAFVFDRRLVDGAVGLIAKGVGALATVGRRLQTGLVRTYAVAFLVGVVGLLWYLAARA
jgi:NADH-quinone oxidoreductase subunit L